MISREEAIEKLKDMRDEAQGWNDTLFTVSGKLANSFEVDVQTFNMAIEALSHERPKGRWIGWHTDKFVGYDEYGIAIYRHCHYYSCRKCGRRTAVKTNYCPDCGAEMVRGEEE